MNETTSVDRERVFQQERDELMRRQQDHRVNHNTKLREARLAALEDEKKATAERHRAVAEATLKAELRRAYLANPVATEADFERAFPQLRQAHLAREAVLAPQREKAAMLRDHRYRL